MCLGVALAPLVLSRTVFGILLLPVWGVLLGPRSSSSYYDFHCSCFARRDIYISLKQAVSFYLIIQTFKSLICRTRTGNGLCLVFLDCIHDALHFPAQGLFVNICPPGFNSRVLFTYPFPCVPIGFRRLCMHANPRFTVVLLHNRVRIPLLQFVARSPHKINKNLYTKLIMYQLLQNPLLLSGLFPKMLYIFPQNIVHPPYNLKNFLWSCLDFKHMEFNLLCHKPEFQVFHYICFY